MKSIYTMVGMQHKGAKTLVAEMKRGTPLLLRRDQNNPHDFNAVEVWHEGKHIAFVKGTEVALLARTMDHKSLLEVPAIFTVTPDRWPQVEVDL